MQLELTPERLDQRRERMLVTFLGPLEIDGHRVNDTRSVGNGPAVRFAASRCLLTSKQRRIGDELIDGRPLQESGRNSSQSEQRARTCARRLAYGPTEACPRSSGRERA